MASLVSNATVVTVDATTNRNAFDTADEQWLLIQVILVTITFVLYILTTRKYCAASSTSRDLRVSAILITTADLNIIISIALLLSHTSMALVPLAIVAIGQLILFVLFASSSKVLHCCTCKEDVIRSIAHNLVC